MKESKTEINFDFENRPYKFIDIESKEELNISPNSIKEKYQNLSKKFQEELRIMCYKYKIDFIEVDINNGFENILDSYLLKRQKMF